jgi:hypothetical protein
MERRLQARAARARVLIVRAGDFFGPKAGNNWFSQGLVKPGRPVKAVSYPASAARPPMVLPAGRGAHHGRVAGAARRLEPFARFHMAGHWDADGTQMSGAIRAWWRAARAPHRA